MTHSYEIEIKSLLGGKEKADELKAKMKALDPNLVEVGSHKQLNHYFIDGDLHQLYQNVSDIIEADKKDKLAELADKAKDFSVRTRWADGKVILVLKASVDDTTSSNGTARLEWESKVSPPFQGGVPATAGGVVGDNTAADEIQWLDDLVLKSGFKYQAKWSRERQEFKYHPSNDVVQTLGLRDLPYLDKVDINVSIDKNAGYGYLSEFEIVVNDQTQAEDTKAFIRNIMKSLEITELPQDRLARMFDYYNHNWEQYYGTDNIFNIE